MQRIRRTASLHRRRLGLGGTARPEGDAGSLLAAGFPDRVALSRGPGMAGAFRLAGGPHGITGARLPDSDPLAQQRMLAVADLELKGSEARIRMAAPVSRAALERRFPDRFRAEEHVAFDARAGAVLARRRAMFGPLVLEEAPLSAPPDPSRVALALARAAAEREFRDLAWTEAAKQLRARVARMRALEGEPWPAEPLLTPEGLAPHLSGMTRLSELPGLDLCAVLLPWELRRRLDEALPPRIALAGGRSAALDYAAETPTVEARAQHFYGLRALPRLAGGRLPLQAALLSPAGRPIAVTADLAGFWKGGWRDARKDMRGRYPKHDWPEDPSTA